MTQFRKKPVVIEAFRWTGYRDQDEDPAWIIHAIREFKVRIHGGRAQGGPRLQMEIDTLEGTMTAEPGDWIIQGVKGEIYPCKPDIFELTYEAVEP